MHRRALATAAVLLLSGSCSTLEKSPLHQLTPPLSARRERPVEEGIKVRSLEYVHVDWSAPLSERACQAMEEFIRASEKCDRKAPFFPAFVIFKLNGSYYGWYGQLLAPYPRQPVWANSYHHTGSKTNTWPKAMWDNAVLATRLGDRESIMPALEAALAGPQRTAAAP